MLKGQKINPIDSPLEEISQSPQLIYRVQFSKCRFCGRKDLITNFIIPCECYQLAHPQCVIIWFKREVYKRKREYKDDAYDGSNIKCLSCRKCYCVQMHRIPVIKCLFDLKEKDAFILLGCVVLLITILLLFIITDLNPTLFMCIVVATMTAFLLLFCEHMWNACYFKQKFKITESYMQMNREVLAKYV